MAQLDFQTAYQCATKLGLRNTGLDALHTRSVKRHSRIHIGCACPVDVRNSDTLLCSRKDSVARPMLK